MGFGVISVWTIHRMKWVYAAPHLTNDTLQATTPLRRSRTCSCELKLDSLTPQALTSCNNRRLRWFLFVL